ncbi:MAG: bifunctional hydroxymethylpyrimidine kinase/phosphomethylpyrimidine kinase [Verrucomicrobia bacterium]|nr:bifunctional hydroxymethylpyrimidine kinase/phosphomethylpyrimidine kinase [Verrucomicrobiota bacterium]MBT5479284.1 bifunctional hydroxymethylpyrimidine kinase/phosphomethylpyrimidine kinase [Verrucomicrobiota bacterium]MBT6240110.1 bifunctional hydroxymethylpyrimidine kinase/phosphomethylpyrimidine kinase [Verrucomicrobiota bacterium]MBT7536570.1 bifunctional hydroxymethylpyrimidine kinase/phosphomethylpyrimidine kinase [Verrucomicrobiota bacterium]MBT7874673.1 bifunctional hydroxymethylpy
MTKKPINDSTPCAMTIAGSDSGGGAGIQTDLKTFAGFEVHGTSVVTCVTAQNPHGVLDIQPISSRVVEKQFEALLNGFKPKAVKSGMLFASSIVKAVVNGLRMEKPDWYVMDPVMVATSGGCLLKSSCIQLIQKKLIPLADLITPNIAEAEVLLGVSIRTNSQVKNAVKKLVDRYERPFLLKGGHLPSKGLAVDYLYDGQTMTLLESKYIHGRKTHGTGCTYAAAITAQLALGKSLIPAVTIAKKFISKAISHSYKTGHYEALNIWKAASA